MSYFRSLMMNQGGGAEFTPEAIAYMTEYGIDPSSLTCTPEQVARINSWNPLVHDFADTGHANWIYSGGNNYIQTLNAWSGSTSWHWTMIVQKAYTSYNLCFGSYSNSSGNYCLLYVNGQYSWNTGARFATYAMPHTNEVTITPTNITLKITGKGTYTQSWTEGTLNNKVNLMAGYSYSNFRPYFIGYWGSTECYEGDELVAKYCPYYDSESGEYCFLEIISNTILKKQGSGSAFTYSMT